MVNLVKDLIKLNLWSNDMKNKIIMESLQDILKIPNDIKLFGKLNKKIVWISLLKFVKYF